MSLPKRRRLYVDSKIQGALMLRVTAYWLFCLLTIIVTLTAWRLLTTPMRAMHTHFNDMLFHYGPAIVAAVLLLPVVILDVLRLSNRFVGPFFRLRRAMRQVANGDDVELVRFRKGDFWQEFAEEFNTMVERINAAEERRDNDQLVKTRGRNHVHVLKTASMRPLRKMAKELVLPVASPIVPPDRHRSDRRGSIAVLSAMFLVILLACIAFAIDVGYMCVARSQAQNAADAASMAAAWGLLDESRLRDDLIEAELAGQARDIGIDFAARNKVCGSGPLLERNATNQPNGDFVFGRLNSNGAMSTFGNLREHNAVLVRIRRTTAMNGPVSLYFARCLGVNSVDISAEAVATFLDGIQGFRATPKTGNLTLIPFGIHIDVWRQLMEGSLGDDDWAVDSETNWVGNGEDGILELDFYPNATGSSGNFGTLQIGDPNNGTPELITQIANGISKADLDFLGGEIGIGSCPGDTGISGGIKHGLQEIIGVPRSIALYDSVSGTGNNAVYNVVGFAGIRVVDFFLDDDDEDYRVVVQPAVVVDDAAIPGDGRSYSVYQRVVLAR